MVLSVARLIRDMTHGILRAQIKISIFTKLVRIHSNFVFCVYEGGGDVMCVGVCVMMIGDAMS